MFGIMGDPVAPGRRIPSILVEGRIPVKPSINADPTVPLQNSLLSMSHLAAEVQSFQNSRGAILC
jgi:hypothetical protein